MMLPLLLAAALAPPAPATIDLGASRLYVQADDGAQLVGMQLVVGGGTARQGPTQAGLAALAAETVLHTKIGGTALIDRVAAAGGSISYTIEPGVVRFSLEALPDALPAIARDVAAAFSAPDTSTAAIAAARASIAARIDDEERNPLIVGLQMLRSSYYVGGAGLPTLGTRASLAGLQGSDVAAFVAAHYLRGDAFAAATGRIDAAVSDAARTALAGLPEGSETLAPIAVRPLEAAGKQIITHRDIGIPVVLIGFAAPSLGDPDFAAMLVVRAMIESAAQRSTTRMLSDFERGLAAIYSYDVKPATLTIALNGGRIDPTLGQSAIRALVRRAAAQPFDAEALARYRNAARGKWLLEAVSLTDRAWQIGAAVSVGSQPNAAAGVAAALEAVSAEDVQRVARTYLQRSTVATVLPRGRGDGT
jgi:zinc protease